MFASSSKGKARAQDVPENGEVARLNDEIQSIAEEIASLQKVHKTLIAKRDLLNKSNRAQAATKPIDLVDHRETENIDYFHAAQFPWSGELLPRAQRVWGIEKFRTIQEAVCNAAMDGRDVVCVMPTGGGKSLCYQLPAILSIGLTLVISPLLSLSMDQMWHLREAGVSCEMLSSASPAAETQDILRRLREGNPQSHQTGEMKVLFVTPERVAKSKTLQSALQRCYERSRLARIVIDEAHCCSQMGHDFRPDYKKLALLRNLYPGVPMLCLSATLAPRVLDDVRNILNLPPVVEPTHSPPDGTVYFASPLHRPNLHYSVLSRPSATKDAYDAITKWILANHEQQSGIVYTQSRAETERMAQALAEISSGRIRAAVYHADVEDAEKTSIHKRWRNGSVHVVVATIAFGMGIDKGDVRFVIHASLGKSLDSYYQETGRAGRDGSDADCVLFYRPADAARVSGLLVSDYQGQQKLHSMLEYAQSTKCRKIIFGKYFQDRYGSDEACGVCDNCIEQRRESDVTTEAWKLLRVLEEAYRQGGRITLAGLADLARGLGGGRFNVVETSTGKGRKGRQSAKVAHESVANLTEWIGEKVKLGKEDTERVLIDLLLGGFIQDEFSSTAYTTNVYTKPGAMSRRLTRLPLEAVEAKQGCPIVMSYIQGKGKSFSADATATMVTSETPTPAQSSSKGKRKRESLQTSAISNVAESVSESPTPAVAAKTNGTQKRVTSSAAVAANALSLQSSTDSGLTSATDERPRVRKRTTERARQPKRIKSDSQDLLDEPLGSATTRTTLAARDAKFSNGRGQGHAKWRVVGMHNGKDDNEDYFEEVRDGYDDSEEPSSSGPNGSLHGQVIEIDSD